MSGYGVAALAAAAVLGRAGIPFSLADAPSAVRLLTLNRPTQELLADLFSQKLLKGLATSGGRIVDWEQASTATRVEDDALVIDLATLLARMRDQIALAQHPLPSPAIRIMAGGRETNARLTAAPPLATCYWDRLQICVEPRGTGTLAGQHVYAGEHGWTFTAARLGGGWFAQATVLPGVDAGERAAVSLARAMGLAHAGDIPVPDGWIDTAPALGSAVGPASQLYAGDAAVAYDPLCGDGCGHALRSGVLAAAVAVRALRHPEEAEQARGWYRSRLRLSFVQHLNACADIYGRARFAKQWQQYHAALLRLSTRLNLLGGDTDLSYHLIDTQLVPVEEANPVESRPPLGATA